MKTTLARPHRATHAARHRQRGDRVTVAGRNARSFRVRIFSFSPHLADPLTSLSEYRSTGVGSENSKGERAMKRTLLGLLLGCIALVGLAAPTPANAWCRCHSAYYGAYAAYAYYRPVVAYQPVVAYRPVVAAVVVRPVVAAVAVPVVRVAYQPVYYTSYAYRTAVVGSAYAYAPGFRRVWWRY